MATNKKITSLTELSQAPAPSDLMPIVDISDTSMAVTGTDKKIKYSNLTNCLNVKSYGATGDGITDDTVAVQAAVTAANANGGGTVYVPPGTYMIKANVPDTATTTFLHDEGGVAMLDNTHLMLDHGATLKAIANSQKQYNIIRIYNKTNVTISGGTIQGERTTHTGSTGEWGYGIAITAGSNIVVRDITLKDCWGDGIDIQQLSGVVTSNVLLQNVYSDNNRRQGLSIEGVDGFLALNCTFTGTNGTAPASGVDIEPYDNNATVSNISFINCSFTDNDGCGLESTFRAVQNLTVKDCYFDGNQNVQGQLLTYHPNTARGVTIVNNTIVNTPSSSHAMFFQGGNDYVVNGNHLDNRIFFENSAGSIVSNVTNVKCTDNTIVAPAGMTEPLTWVFIGNTTSAYLSDNTIDNSAIASTVAVGFRVGASANITIKNNRLINVFKATSVTGSTGTDIDATDYTDEGVFLPANVSFKEDFTYGSSTNVTTGSVLTFEQGWAGLQISGGTQVFAITTGSFANPGQLAITTSASSGQGGVLYRPGNNKSSFGALGSNADWEGHFVFSLASTADVALRAGFCSETTHNGDAPTNWFGVEYDTTNTGNTDTDFTWVTRATTSSYSTTNAIAADTSFHHLRVRSTVAGTIGFQIDGGTEFTTTNHVTTGNMTMFAQIITRTAATKTLTLDFISYLAVTGRT